MRINNQKIRQISRQKEGGESRRIFRLTHEIEGEEPSYNLEHPEAYEKHEAEVEKALEEVLMRG